MESSINSFDKTDVDEMDVDETGTNVDELVGP